MVEYDAKDDGWLLRQATLLSDARNFKKSVVCMQALT